MNPLAIIGLLLLMLETFGAVPTVSEVMSQTGDAMPKNWGIRNGQPVPADYGMDPEVVDDARYRSLLPQALRSLPSLMVTMADDDLFGADRGIYAHPLETGDEWERPARAVLVETNGTNRFEISCGIQIHGGWNRRPEESPKHAFRLVFKKKYGLGKLKAAVFGEGAATEFDTVVLRAGCNNTWLHWSGVERKRGEYLRDQWMRDTHRAMGYLSPHGIFVHLYLNHLYWGVYNLVERPDESFASTYLGGRRKDYDVRNSDKILAGDAEHWNGLMKRINAGIRSDEDLEEAAKWIDVTAFADYMLLNLYGSNADWDRSSNWYAVRARKENGQWQFFIWDAERTLENVEDNTLPLDDDQSPTRIFQRLRESAAFRKLFAERARKHLQGALAPGTAASRYATLAKNVELGMIAESARWGDYRRDVHRYREGPYELYTPEDWKREVNRLLKDYFPRRGERLAEQLRGVSLFE